MPWQPSGNGRSGWSTKLIRGLKAEAAAGFQSRRERCSEPTPVTPQYAAFSTYKAARVHQSYCRCFRGGVAAGGGPAAGFSIVAPDLSGKRLQLLKELLPGLSSVAAISTVTNPQAPIEFKETQAAAKTLDIVLRSIQVSDEVSVESAFDAIKQASAQAVIVLTDAILYSQ
jgi:hypothetical protein